jgi:hypothetical protein
VRQSLINTEPQCQHRHPRDRGAEPVWIRPAASGPPTCSNLQVTAVFGR